MTATGPTTPQGAIDGWPGPPARVKLTQAVFDAADRGRADIRDSVFLRGIFEAAGVQIEPTAAELEEVDRLRTAANRLLEQADRFQDRIGTRPS